MKLHHRPALTALLAAGLSMSALASCGSDTKSSKLSKAACDAAVEYGAAFAQAPQDPAELGAYAEDTLVPIGEQLVDGFTKGDAAKAAKTLQQAFETIASSGDPSVIEEPATATATSTIGKAVHEQCDAEAVDIEAVEYAFIGAPSSLPSGRVSFALENTGVEEHEMVLFKRADGVTDGLDAILELPEDELMTKVEFTGVAFGEPGTTNYVALDLEPGTYFLLCFIPQSGDGPPHFMGGMKQTVEVV